jgi:hypothetical protein
MKNLHPVDTQQTNHHANRILNPIVHKLHHKTTHFDVQKHYAEKHKHNLKKKKKTTPIARKLRTLSNAFILDDFKTKNINKHHFINKTQT